MCCWYHSSYTHVVFQETSRTIVSGLVKFVEEDTLRGAIVCVLCNLKPSKLRGIVSHVSFYYTVV